MKAIHSRYGHSNSVCEHIVWSKTEVNEIMNSMNGNDLVDYYL